MTWWSWRWKNTRSLPELGREKQLRQWYFASRHGRVGRRQVFSSLKSNACFSTGKSEKPSHKRRLFCIQNNKKKLHEILHAAPHYPTQRTLFRHVHSLKRVKTADANHTEHQLPQHLVKTRKIRRHVEANQKRTYQVLIRNRGRKNPANRRAPTRDKQIPTLLGQRFGWQRG